ncbi:hypothetical protein EI94DRAFT_1749731, partial [Lactarius quietus]
GLLLLLYDHTTFSHLREGYVFHPARQPYLVVFGYSTTPEAGRGDRDQRWWHIFNSGSETLLVDKTNTDWCGDRTHDPCP